MKYLISNHRMLIFLLSLGISPLSSVISTNENNTKSPVANNDNYFEVNVNDVQFNALNGSIRDTIMNMKKCSSYSWVISTANATL